VPGAWCDPVQLDCANYYPLIDQFLLNRNHTILPAAQAVGRADELFSRFGADGQLFVRPTDCGKTFVGRCVNRDEFVLAPDPVRHDSTAQIVLATPTEVGWEWRLLVQGKEIVSGTQCSKHGVKEVRPGCPAEVRQFATEILTTIRRRPDPEFFLDVGESTRGLAVIEVSGFSCSWMDACDVRNVVDAIWRPSFALTETRIRLG
jgi:ATP-grasp domain, R2K clade family 3